MKKEFTAIGELYAQSLNRFHAETAVIEGAKRLSYDDLAERVGRTLAAFDRIGLAPGSRVALGLNISTDFIVLVLAAHVAGLTVIELSPQLPAEMLQHRVTLAAVDAAFLRAADYPEATRGSLGALPCKVYGIGAADPGEDFLAIAQDCSPVPVRSRPSDGPAAINFTSGSTGLPKGISVAQHVPAAQTLALMATVNHPARPVCVLGLTHPVVMHMLLTPAILRGGAVVVVPSADLDVTVQAAKQHRANFLFLPTRMLYQLLDSGDAEWIKGQIELFYYGGENMTVERLREAIATCGSIFAQTFGASESGPVGLLRPQDHDPDDPEVLTSIGKPVIGAEFAVWDESGQPLPDDTPGQLVLTAPTVMTEYLNNPAKTRETLIDGWIKPGDIGYRSARGYYYLLDRDSFALEIEGRKIYPRTIELSLGRHPGVSGVFAMGVPDPQGEKRLCVAIKAKRGANTSAEDIARYVQEHHQVRPHRVLFLDDFPLNPVSRKIDRPKLEALFQQEDAR